MSLAAHWIDPMKSDVIARTRSGGPVAIHIAPLICLVIVLLASVSPAHATYVKRYTTIARGGMTFTGNTLGLSNGTNGSIGAFISTNTALSAGGSYPAGTTLAWALNSSSAQLRLPAGSSVIYAELIWGGSYNYGGQNVSAYLNNAVTLTGPGGSVSVSPSPSTAAVTGSTDYYYVRSADVTMMVTAGGAGTYTVGGVPATVSSSELNANAAGWTLAVVYGNSSLPARNMTVFVGAELTSTSVTTTSSVSGFCTPGSGTISARLMVSAIEGDPGNTGDAFRHLRHQQPGQQLLRLPAQPGQRRARCRGHLRHLEQHAWIPGQSRADRMGHHQRGRLRPDAGKPEHGVRPWNDHE
jgi:hypothetical protein